MKDRSSTVFFFLPNWYKVVEVFDDDGIVVVAFFAAVVGREVVKASVLPRMNRTASAKKTSELLRRCIMVEEPSASVFYRT